MQGKTQQVETDVQIVQPTNDTPGGYWVRVGGKLVDYTDPDLFQAEQRTLEPVKAASGIIWTPSSR